MGEAVLPVMSSMTSAVASWPPSHAQNAAKRAFGGRKVVLSVVPQGKVELAAEGTLIPGKEDVK